MLFQGLLGAMCFYRSFYFGYFVKGIPGKINIQIYRYNMVGVSYYRGMFIEPPRQVYYGMYQTLDLVDNIITVYNTISYAGSLTTLEQPTCGQHTTGEYSASNLNTIERPSMNHSRFCS